MVYGLAASAPPGACEKYGVSGSAQIYWIWNFNLTSSPDNSWPHSSLRHWTGWVIKCLWNLPEESSYSCWSSLSSRKTDLTVKGRQTLQPSVLSPVVGPWHKLCRTQWFVSMCLPFTPTPFKKTTTRTWNKIKRAKVLEDVSLKCGWPAGKLAWPEMSGVFTLEVLSFVLQIQWSRLRSDESSTDNHPNL